MKNMGKFVGIVFLGAIIVFAMAACGEPPVSEQTPVVGDYDITPNPMTQAVGNVTGVTIAAKSGKSNGPRTIYYEGTAGTTYAKSTTVPTAATAGSSYSVTFDVAPVSGWKAAYGLNAGTLTVVASVGNQTPVAADYTVSNLLQTQNIVTAVSIKAKAGKSSGAITISYAGSGSTTFTKSTTIPQAKGTYAVTFDVAAATGWNAATDLSGGTLTVNELGTPVATDYVFSNMTQSLGEVTAIVITPKDGKSGGKRMVYYDGGTPLPQVAGIYDVTFDVEAVAAAAATATTPAITGWNEAKGLVAGKLEINSNKTPKREDFNIIDESKLLSLTVGTTFTAAEIATAKTGVNKPTGAITVYYEGVGSTTYAKSTTFPTATVAVAGSKFTVTFDVAAVTGSGTSPSWNAATFFVGTMTFSAGNQTPVAGDYDISNNLTQYVGSVTAVTATAKAGKSSGAVTVHYTGISPASAKSDTLPTTVGTYKITFSVAAATGWIKADDLDPSKTLTIAALQTPVVGDFDVKLNGSIVSSSSYSVTQGSSYTLTVTPKDASKSQGQVTYHYVSTSPAYNSETPPTAAGTYAVTFSVAAAIGWSVASGLSAGTLTITDSEEGE
jgi:hypothetical protein